MFSSQPPPDRRRPIYPDSHGVDHSIQSSRPTDLPRYDMVAETTEVERRCEAIMSEFGLTGVFTEILARRVAQLSVRLERFARFEAAMKAAGRGASLHLSEARKYEEDTHRSLLRTIKELHRYLPPPNQLSAKSDVRWLRYTQFGGSRTVEAAVVSPKSPLPTREEFQKQIDAQGKSALG